MTLSCRSVKVHRFPIQVSNENRGGFLKILRREAEIERPSFILDFSRLISIDERGMFLLLECLEEAIKGNGDVRLAGVQPQVAEKLHAAGIGSLFEMFNTIDSAASSFQKSANSRATLTFSEEFIEADVRAVA